MELLNLKTNHKMKLDNDIIHFYDNQGVTNLIEQDKITAKATLWHEILKSLNYKESKNSDFLTKDNGLFFNFMFKIMAPMACLVVFYAEDNIFIKTILLTLLLLSSFWAFYEQRISLIYHDPDRHIKRLNNSIIYRFSSNFFFKIHQVLDTKEEKLRKCQYLKINKESKFISDFLKNHYLDGWKSFNDLEIQTRKPQDFLFVYKQSYEQMLNNRLKHLDINDLQHLLNCIHYYNKLINNGFDSTTAGFYFRDKLCNSDYEKHFFINEVKEELNKNNKLDKFYFNLIKNKIVSILPQELDKNFNNQKEHIQYWEMRHIKKNHVSEIVFLMEKISNLLDKNPSITCDFTEIEKCHDLESIKQWLVNFKNNLSNKIHQEIELDIFNNYEQ